MTYSLALNPVQAEDLETISEVEEHQIDELIDDVRAEDAPTKKKPPAKQAPLTEGLAVLIEQLTTGLGGEQQPSLAQSGKEMMELMRQSGLNNQKTATDYRKAAEAMASFGKSLEALVPAIMDGMNQVGQHGSSAMQHFDPMGLKKALETIQQQNHQIQDLQRTQIEALKAEIEKLKGPKKKSRR
ncbi:MAG: hypothetical protein AAF492_00560 [Verrucomicrobiota bacterium]